jgi:hypothetical protein
MKCPGDNVLQAYIDGELEIGTRKNLETHLENCVECKNLLAVLKENDDFVFTKLEGYRQHFEEVNVPWSSQPMERNHNINIKEKGVFSYMLKYKKFVAVACAALVITAGVTIQPVKAAIESALSIFRVENVKGVNVTLADIQDIQNKLASGQGDINLDKMGSIKMEGGHKKVASKEEVRNLSDVPVAFPAVFNNETPKVSIVEPASVDFTLNVKNVNQTMKAFGANKVLPDKLDGKTFNVSFASQVTMKYTINNKSITIMQTKTPEIKVPSDVNVDEVYNAVVDMPILPKDLQAQLRSIKDWKNTLYIPVVESEMKEVDINGVKGYMSLSKGNSENSTEAFVIWFDKGIYRAVSGNIDSNEALNIARSMK